MTMQNHKVLQLLGYSENEAKVYLTSLRLGESHISDIADAAKMPRSTAQLIAEKLHKDGLMNFYVMRRYKYWIAENPQQLLKILYEREAALKEVMPKLSAMRNKAGKTDRYDEQYKKSIKVFSNFADTSPQAVLVTNSDIEIVYVNKAWQKLFGYAPEEVFGKNPRILQSGKTPAHVYQKMWRALHTETLFQSDEIIDTRKDGTDIKLLTTIFPVQHGNRIFYIQILAEAAKKR